MRDGTVLPTPLAPLLAGHALQALTSAALRAGGRTDTVGSDGTRQEIEHGLGTGDPHDRQLLRVAQMADSLLRQELAALHQVYRTSGAAAYQRPVPSVRSAISQTPGWMVNFMDLSERLRRRTPIARQLPQTIDLAVFDALLGGDTWRAPAFDHLFSLEHRQALTIALTCIDRAVPALAPYLAPALDLPFKRAGPRRSATKTPTPCCARQHNPPPRTRVCLSDLAGLRSRALPRDRAGTVRCGFARIGKGCLRCRLGCADDIRTWAVCWPPSRTSKRLYRLRTRTHRSVPSRG